MVWSLKETILCKSFAYNHLERTFSSVLEVSYCGEPLLNHNCPELETAGTYKLPLKQPGLGIIQKTHRIIE